MSGTTAEESGSKQGLARGPRSTSNCRHHPRPVRRKKPPEPADEAAHVLVVDDEEELRDLLTDALAAADVLVTAAASGQEALDAARSRTPDLLIADIRLGDCTGLEVIDELRRAAGEVPVLVITGYGDAETFADASRRRPIEIMTKPLDIGRLRRTVLEELARRAGPEDVEGLRRHNDRLRRKIEHMNDERRSAQGQLKTTCEGLASAYRTLSGQLSLQQMVITYQHALIAAKNDDQVFAALFRLFAIRSGPVFGVAMVCDEHAELQLIGRFGVPHPDSLAFCQRLARPVVDLMIEDPTCLLLDAGADAKLFDASIRRHLPGLTVLAIPLLPAQGEMIGAAVLYRKGEQPFPDADVTLAEMVAYPTAAAVRRND